MTVFIFIIFFQTVKEYAGSFCSVGSAIMLSYKRHWNLWQKEDEINKCPCCLFKDKCWVWPCMA